MKILYTILLISLLIVFDAKADIPTVAIRSTSVQDVCTTLTSTVRDVPKSVKKYIYIRDGGNLNRTSDYEVDHRISLSVGGSNDVQNLKLQSYLGSCNAYDKDKLEMKVRTLVCKGKMPLSEAQNILYNNWEIGYKKYINSTGCTR